MYEPGIDVVMVNYRTPQDARNFVVSYAETRSSDCSLNVVNVDSSDEDREAMEVALLDMPGDHGLITFETNCGYATACNNAATFGNRQVLAFFNADTRLAPGVLENVSNALLANASWAIAGPRQVDDDNLITSAGIFGDEAHPRLRGWKELDVGQYCDILEAVSVSGSAYFVRRDAWDELTECPIFRELYPDADGAFLPTPHFYEETWCSYHARSHGWTVTYYGAVAMVHRWHQASPVGGYAQQVMPKSQQMFREMCDAHRIDHD